MSFLPILIALLALLLTLLLTLLLLNLNRLITYIAQLLVDASQLEITQITITSCTDTTFLLSLTATITNTGPLPATITNLPLTMHATKSGPAFARIDLPPIAASPTGTTLSVTAQPITILDARAFHTFSRNLLLQAELPAYLHGTGTLTLTLPLAKLRTQIRYEKVALLRGLDGVHIDVLETRKASRALLRGKPTAIEVDVRIASRSPVAVDMGFVRVAIEFSGVRIATAEGELFLREGENRVCFRGAMDVLSISKNLATGARFLKKDVLDAPAGVEAWVKGVGGEQCAWLDETVKLMNSRVEMGNTMADLLRSIYKVEEAED